MHSAEATLGGHTQPGLLSLLLPIPPAPLTWASCLLAAFSLQSPHRPQPSPLRPLSPVSGPFGCKGKEAIGLHEQAPSAPTGTNSAVTPDVGTGASKWGLRKGLDLGAWKVGGRGEGLPPHTCPSLGHCVHRRTDAWMEGGHLLVASALPLVRAWLC